MPPSSPLRRVASVPAPEAPGALVIIINILVTFIIITIIVITWSYMLCRPPPRPRPKPPPRGRQPPRPPSSNLSPGISIMPKIQKKNSRFRYFSALNAFSINNNTDLCLSPPSWPPWPRLSLWNLSRRLKSLSSSLSAMLRCGF